MIKPHRVLIERKWAAAIKAVYSQNYLDKYLNEKLKTVDVTVSDEVIGSLAALYIETDDVRGRGPLFNETINELLLNRVKQIGHMECCHVEDPYALAVLCETGVIHDGVLAHLTRAARRQVLEFSMDGGISKSDRVSLNAASRLRSTKGDI